jgi:hypothetical protein
VHRLLNTLDELTKDSDRQVYVLSGSVTLNTDMLKNGCYYFNPEFRELDKKILRDSHIDKRDGFPFQMLQADYLVVTMPANYLQFPDGQRVVWFLSEQITYGENIGKAYKKMPYIFSLEDGRDVSIYRKTREFTENELREISNIFVGFYPNDREKFEITQNMIDEQTATKP